MDALYTVLLTLGLAGNLVAHTVLLIGFFNKFRKRTELASMVAQYQILPNRLSIKAVPYLLALEASVIGVGIGALMAGNIMLSCLVLITIYSVYTLLLLSVKLRKIPIVDCGCYLSTEYKGRGVETILLRNGILLFGLMASVVLFHVGGALTYAVVISALLFSALEIVLLTGFEVLVANSKKLQKLKVRHG